MTIDVENPNGSSASVILCLDLLCQVETKTQTDSEFVERQGVIHISRLLPDWSLTKLQGHHPSDRLTETIDLQANQSMVQLGAERLGNIDSIHYHEVSSERTPLEDGFVEVEVYAAGLNYKDVVVTMGIVPGDERELGGEAAGIVTKVSPSVTDFTVGQRVVVSASGAFSNRLHAKPARMHLS
jgi:hypothetical protein